MDAAVIKDKNDSYFQRKFLEKTEMDDTLLLRNPK